MTVDGGGELCGALGLGRGRGPLDDDRVVGQRVDVIYATIQPHPRAAQIRALVAA